MRDRIESFLKVNIDGISVEMVIKSKSPIVDSFEQITAGRMLKKKSMLMFSYETIRQEVVYKVSIYYALHNTTTGAS